MAILTPSADDIFGNRSPRGAIRSPDLARQLCTYEDLRIGNITPTDLDGLIEYRGEALILIELKFGEQPLGVGQQRAFVQLIDWIPVGVRACLMVAQHFESSPTVVIDAAACPVREYYFRGEWRSLQRPATLKELVFRFLRVPLETPLAVSRVRRDERIDMSNLANYRPERLPGT
jgi:hypothetical protein